MFRTQKTIILAAAAFYAVALLIAWQQMDMRADRRTDAMLTAAERGFSDVINGELDAALRNVGGAIINVLGRKCAPQSLERMQDLAKTFNLDEINIVDARGIVIGSNLPEVMGYDFNDNPLTREFMALTNANVTLVSQPFRRGVANPDMVCKYHGVSFPGKDGFIQLGMTVKRLRENMYTYTAAEADRILKDWHFSVVGWYERIEKDTEFEPGRMVRRWSDEHGEMLVGRFFGYLGYRYVALLPESYCFSQRNAAFMVTALVLGVLLFLFAYVLIRLAKASANLEKMHAAAEARTAADLALAKTIQTSALPSCEGAFLGHLDFVFRAASRPAREVGGDFYDFYAVSGERIVFLVADVSGKGIPGAMFMMEAKNILKSCLTAFADVSEAVTEANRRICENNKAELFVTAWIGVLNQKNGVFEYVNAGHNRPFVRRADGKIEKVMGKGGRFLGMFEDAIYRSHELKLAPGDILFLYTDGITEAMNARGEQFGEDRLCAALTGDYHDESVARALDEFVGGAEQSDDLTALVFRWNGAPSCAEQVFPSRPDSLASAVSFIRSALDGVDRKVVASVLNAADEITSNIVNYSEAREFRITVEKGFDRLRLSLADDGKIYNPLSHVDPDTHASIEDRPIGGLGLVVVKRLADRVTYSRENGRNVLTLIKRF